METRLTYRPKTSPVRGLLHSIWLRVLGFAWMFCASLILVAGGALAFLGVGGHLLVRARPDTGDVINYDPSTVATFSPLPITVGLLLVLGFVLSAQKLRN